MQTTSNFTTLQRLSRIFNIYKTSETEIRPHSVLTGPSGSGKSFTVNTLAAQLEIPVIEINAAQLTKEGTSGNSLSKALAPLAMVGGQPVIVFVDEFDKLFISGNTNSALAHETTNGVQNEFLKVLEGRTTSVYGDYGKYLEVPCDNVLFVFAGAFNGEENITIDRLREFGIKTEFLGRVGLAFSLEKLSLLDLKMILETSPLLQKYLDLFENANREAVVKTIMAAIEENYEKNTLGARMVHTLIHQYFINGGLEKEETKKVTFQKKLTL